jgi:hypothetical protein
MDACCLANGPRAPGQSLAAAGAYVGAKRRRRSATSSEGEAVLRASPSAVLGRAGNRGTQIQWPTTRLIPGHECAWAQHVPYALRRPSASQVTVVDLTRAEPSSSHPLESQGRKAHSNAGLQVRPGSCDRRRLDATLIPPPHGRAFVLLRTQRRRDRRSPLGFVRPLLEARERAGKS